MISNIELKMTMALEGSCRLGKKVIVKLKELWQWVKTRIVKDKRNSGDNSRQAVTACAATSDFKVKTVPLDPTDEHDRLIMQAKESLRQKQHLDRVREQQAKQNKKPGIIARAWQKLKGWLGFSNYQYA